MEIIADLLKITIPAVLVLYSMYLTVRAFLNKDFESRLAAFKAKNTEAVFSIRLQAYERMCLFLERVSPANLLIRINPSEFTAGELQQIMLHEIRNEFAHNLAQQMYMSQEAWERIKNAKEEVIALINNSAGQINEEARGLELAKLVLENMQAFEIDPTLPAIYFLKEEVQKLF